MKNKNFKRCVVITSIAYSNTFTEQKPYSKFRIWLKENIFNTDNIFYVYIFSFGIYGALHSMGVI